MRFKLILAFAAVYIIWGSTYLAIRFAIESIPPFSMAAIRFLVAGTVLFAWARWRSNERLTWVHWRSAGIVGFLLLVGGNGGVVWAQQTVPSGITALIIAIVPLWMVLLEWMNNGVRPNAFTSSGIFLGLVGILLLIGPGEITGTDTDVDWVGALVLIVATISWAIGSLYSRRAHLPQSPFLATAMEMILGGLFLTVIGFASGETLNVSLASTKSLFALGYLIVFGSMIGFTAYIWILRVAPPSKASTYAFVNPIVAVFLGWLLAGEDLSLSVITAMAIIVTAVAMIIFSREKRVVTKDEEAPISVIPEKEIV